MSKHYRAIALGLMAAVGGSSLLAQTNPTSTLIEQANYWQARGDSVRAAEAWRKLLQINPNHPEALFGLGLADVEAGKLDSARNQLAQLKRVAPASPLVGRLEQSINLGRSPQQVQLARQQAKSGQPDQAVATYRNFFAGTKPQGQLALEFYQTLGGTANGWDEARQGLEQQAKDSPSDAQVALALAQHLTYREPSRKEGIARLSKLSTHAEVGRAAQAAWRRALSWTGTGRADAVLYQNYLRQFPGDEQIQARLNDTQKKPDVTPSPKEPNTKAIAKDPVRLMVADGFKALDANDLEAAEADFRSALSKRPKNSDALGGMGIVHLRQENFAKAREYLQKAARGNPSWKSSLKSANYWSLLHDSYALRSTGDTAGALDALKKAITLDSQESAGIIALGDLFSINGEPAKAETAYRTVLEKQPGNPDAVRGLVEVLARNGRADQAQELLDKLTLEQQAGMGDMGRLRAVQAAGVAKLAMDKGDLASARMALERALNNDPTNPWIRLDLARVYMKAGASREARGVVDGLLVSNPNLPEALYASALLSSEMSDWNATLATLERVPAAKRTKDMADLHRRAYLQTQVAGASRDAAQGRTRQAQATLDQLRPLVGTDPDLLGALAGGYVDVGDSGQALNLIRQLLSRNNRISPDLQLQYAGILLKTKQDVELAGVLRQLNPATLNEAQRKGFDDLRTAYIIRQADAYREAGDLVLAYDALAPILMERPYDVAATNALARMYMSANDYPQAMALYSRLLEREPNNLDLLMATAGSATAAKDYRVASAAIETALRLAPNNPDVLATAARLYRAQGQTSLAAEYFTAALAAQNRNVPTATNPFAQTTNASGGNSWYNPFAGRSGQRSASTLSGVVPALAAHTPSANPFAPPYGSAYAAPAPAPIVYSGLPATSANPTRQIYAPVFTPQAPAAAQGIAYAPQNPAPLNGIPEPAGTSRMTSLQANPYAPAAPVQAVQTVIVEPYYIDPKAVAQAKRSAEPSAEPAPTKKARKKAVKRKRGARLEVLPLLDAPALPAAQKESATRPAPATRPATPASAVSKAPPPTPTVPAPYEPQLASAAGLIAGAFDQATPAAPSYASSLAPNPVQAPPKTIADELREIEQSRSTTLAGGGMLQVRMGEAGMSQLTTVEFPAEARLNALDGKLVLKFTPVLLSTGSVGTSYDSTSRFGGGPAASVASPGASPGSRNNNKAGVGLALAFETEQLQLDVGTTPLGFLYENVVGGVKYKQPLTDSLTVVADLSRRAVTDSMLSYSGATDVRTGMKWGGVVATGGRIDLIYDQGAYGLYGYGAAHVLDGTRVVSNQRAELGAGMYWHLDRSSFSKLTTGINFNGISYQKNLRYFTYGHGGYFSPQSFVSVGIPLEWAQRNSKLNYLIKGSLSFQHFSENSANYFPGSATLQAQAATAASQAVTGNLTGTARSVYPGQTKSGLGLNLDAAMEYQLARQMFFGGKLSFANSSDFRVFSTGVYLRYALDNVGGASPFPLTPFKSPFTTF